MLNEYSKDYTGDVDFIVNQTKNNYLNLRGLNSDDVIKNLHTFLVKFHVWEATDTVNKAKRDIKFQPSNYHNISFILNFYKIYCKSLNRDPKGILPILSITKDEIDKCSDPKDNNLTNSYSERNSFKRKSSKKTPIKSDNDSDSIKVYIKNSNSSENKVQKASSSPEIITKKKKKRGKKKKESSDDFFKINKSLEMSSPEKPKRKTKRKK